MQTPAILNISSPASGQAAAKPAAGASNGAFNQMLSQQIAERRSSEQAQPPAAPKAAEARTAAQTGKAETKPAAQEGTATSTNAHVREDASAEAAGTPPTATELLAQAAGALLQPQQTLDTAAAADPGTAIQDPALAANAAGRAGKHGLLATADQVLRQAPTNAAGDAADFRNSLQDAAALQAGTGAARGAEGQALDKLTDLAAVKMQEAPATNGTVAQLPPGVQQLAQLADDKAVERLTPRVGTPAWDQSLGQKVVWMVAGAQQSASLTLNPPDLGPLQVVLNVSNGQADASFYAAQPEVRQALEAALPRLRDMMNQAGVELGQASVSAGMPDRNDQPGGHAAQQAGRGGSAGRGTDEAAPTLVHGTQVITGQGLVDTFV